MIVELIETNPKIGIIVLGAVVSLFISLVNYFVLDKENVKKSREKQKDLKEQMKLHKSDSKKMMELNKEMMSHAMENMKHSFKPMLITMIPMLVVIWWIKSVFTGLLAGWIWWYLGSAIFFSLLFRKLFKLP